MHGPAFGTVKCSPPEGITLNGYYVPGGTELSVHTIQYNPVHNDNIDDLILPVYSYPQLWCAECHNTLMIQILLTQADLIQRIKSNSFVIYMYALIHFVLCIGQIRLSTFHSDWAIVPALESTLLWYELLLSTLTDMLCCIYISQRGSGGTRLLFPHVCSRLLPFCVEYKSVIEFNYHVWFWRPLPIHPTYYKNSATCIICTICFFCRWRPK